MQLDRHMFDDMFRQHMIAAGAYEKLESGFPMAAMNSPCNILLGRRSPHCPHPFPAYAQNDAAAAPQSTHESSTHDEIIVTSSPYAIPQDSTPAIVAKVDRNQIVENGGASIANALAKARGDRFPRPHRHRRSPHRRG